MNVPRQITSLSNPTVKAARGLHLRKEREESGLFLGEGLGVDWPGGDAALLYVVAAMLAASQVHVRKLARA